MKKIISEQDINKIHELYPFSKNLSDHVAFGYYHKIYEEHQVIKEYIKSVPYTNVIKQLNKLYPGIIQVTGNLNKILIVFNTIDQTTIEKVNKSMDAFAWYPTHIGNKAPGAGPYSQTTLQNFIGKRHIPILYARKTGELVKPESRFLYHLVPDISYQKVKLYGLITKSQSKLGKHPERIYVLDGLPDNIEEISDYLLSTHKDKNKINKMYLVEIPTDKVHDWEFFTDDDFLLAKAIWTYQMIPPGFIKVVNEFPNNMKDPDNIIQLEEIRRIIQNEIRNLDLEYLFDNFCNIRDNHTEFFRNINSRLLCEYSIDINNIYDIKKCIDSNKTGYQFYDIHNNKHLTLLDSDNKVIFGPCLTNVISDTRFNTKKLDTKISNRVLNTHINNIFMIIEDNNLKSISFGGLLQFYSDNMKKVVLHVIDKYQDKIDGIISDVNETKIVFK